MTEIGNITFSTPINVEFKPQVTWKLKRLFRKITEELSDFMADGINGSVTIEINISEGGMSRTYISSREELR